VAFIEHSTLPEFFTGIVNPFSSADTEIVWDSFKGEAEEVEVEEVKKSKRKLVQAKQKEPKKRK